MSLGFEYLYECFERRYEHFTAMANKTIQVLFNTESFDLQFVSLLFNLFRLCLLRELLGKWLEDLYAGDRTYSTVLVYFSLLALNQRGFNIA